VVQRRVFGGDEDVLAAEAGADLLGADLAPALARLAVVAAPLQTSEDVMQAVVHRDAPGHAVLGEAVGDDDLPRLPVDDLRGEAQAGQFALAEAGHEEGVPDVAPVGRAGVQQAAHLVVGQRPALLGALVGQRLDAGDGVAADQPAWAHTPVEHGAQGAHLAVDGARAAALGQPRLAVGQDGGRGELGHLGHAEGGDEGVEPVLVAADGAGGQRLAFTSRRSQFRHCPGGPAVFRHFTAAHVPRPRRGNTG
jgi:hypothetical protein